MKQDTKIWIDHPHMMWRHRAVLIESENDYAGFQAEQEKEKLKS